MRQLDKVSNQARFIQMCVKKEIVLDEKDEKVIIQELRDLKFKPISQKAAKEGEEEAQQDGQQVEQEEGKSGDFDYLLDMKVRSFSRQKVRLGLLYCFARMNAHPIYVTD